MNGGFFAWWCDEVWCCRLSHSKIECVHVWSILSAISTCYLRCWLRTWNHWNFQCCTSGLKIATVRAAFPRSWLVVLIADDWLTDDGLKFSLRYRLCNDNLYGGACPFVVSNLHYSPFTSHRPVRPPVTPYRHQPRRFNPQHDVTQPMKQFPSSVSKPNRLKAHERKRKRNLVEHVSRSDSCRSLIRIVDQLLLISCHSSVVTRLRSILTLKRQYLFSSLCSFSSLSSLSAFSSFSSFSSMFSRVESS